MADFDRDDGLCKLQLDRDVRDFLLTALRKIQTVLALSDSQLEIVMAAAASLPTEKRATFLERMAGQLERRGRHDADFDKAVQRALQGLIQNSAA